MAESEAHVSLTAGEYVLGVLDEAESDAFERRLQQEAQARDWVVYWEQRLGALGLALAPVQPPAQVWRSVVERLDLEREPESERGVAPPKSDHIGFWRGLAIAASAACLALATMLFTGSTQRAPEVGLHPAYASVVYDEPTGMSWLVTADAGSHKIRVVAMGDYDVPDGKMLRAWLKPKGEKPMLLGEWPHADGDYEMPMPDKVVKSMDRPAKIMVSMEDVSAQGTDQPQPGAKLMWTSPIARRTS